MNKQLSLILASALILSMTGCEALKQTAADREPVITASSQITEQTDITLPAVLPEKDYPITMETEISVEGTPQKLTLECFDGGNYVIYIPQGQWALETTLKNGFLTDRWTNINNENIHFEVISFGTLTPSEAEQKILYRNTAFQFDLSHEELGWGMDYVNCTYLNFKIRSDGKNTFALAAEYPMEAGDGFSPRTGAMMDSFQIK